MFFSFFSALALFHHFSSWFVLHVTCDLYNTINCWHVRLRAMTNLNLVGASLAALAAVLDSDERTLESIALPCSFLAESGRRADGGRVVGGCGALTFDSFMCLQNSVREAM